MRESKPRPRVDWTMIGMIMVPICGICTAPLTVQALREFRAAILGAIVPIFFLVYGGAYWWAWEDPADPQFSPVPSRRTILLQPPGLYLRAWSMFWFSRKTFARVLEPIIADAQHEWLEAHKHGQIAQARLICIRGYVAFFSALITMVPLSLLRWFWQAWKNTKVG